MQGRSSNARNAIRMKTKVSACVSINHRALVERMEDPEFRLTIGWRGRSDLVVNLEARPLQVFAVEKGSCAAWNTKLVRKRSFLNEFWKWPSTGPDRLQRSKAAGIGVALLHGGLRSSFLPA